MARKRFQRGTLRKRVGKLKSSWVAQWREDIVADGQVVRRFVKESWPVEEFPTRKLALRELERRLASSINSPAYRPTHRMLFSEFATHWTEAVLTMHKPSSQNSEKVHLTRYIRPFFGAMYLHDITPMHVQRFVSSLQGIAPKTVRNVYATFRAMWKLAKLQQLVQHNACEGIRMPQLNPVERPAFTIEQMQQIIAAAEEPYKTFFWLAAETGMRIGELLGLRTCDVDYRACTVSVRQAVWSGRVGTPKSAAATRRCGISAGLAEALRNRILAGGDQVSLVFRTHEGRPWDSRFIVRDKLQRILMQLEIPRAGMHAFRHGNATYRLQAGEDVKTLAVRLGHSDPSITLKVYAHASQNTELSNKMGDILCPNTPMNMNDGPIPLHGTKDVQPSFGTLGSELGTMRNAGVGWAIKIPMDAVISATKGASN